VTSKLVQQLSVPLPPGPQLVIPGPPGAQLGGEDATFDEPLSLWPLPLPLAATPVLLPTAAPDAPEAVLIAPLPEGEPMPLADVELTPLPASALPLP
jgi:hypothetical protein